MRFDEADGARQEVEQLKECRRDCLGGHLSEDFSGVRQGRLHGSNMRDASGKNVPRTRAFQVPVWAGRRIPRAGYFRETRKAGRSFDCAAMSAMTTAVDTARSRGCGYRKASAMRRIVAKSRSTSEIARWKRRSSDSIQLSMRLSSTRPPLESVQFSFNAHALQSLADARYETTRRSISVVNCTSLRPAGHSK